MSVSVQSGSVFFGRSEGARLGFSISVAGDIDGDGFADLIFGAPGATIRAADGSFVSILAGEAILIRGSAQGFAPLTRLAIAGGDPMVTVFEGSQAQARTGSAVAGGGDIDGDGYDDLLIGAPFRDGTAGTDAGSAFAVFGGDGALAGWQAGAPGAGSVSQELLGGTLRSYGGYSVAMVGDIDGDGLVDAAIGLPGASLGTRFGAGAVEVRFAGSGDRDLETGTAPGSGLTIFGAAALDYAGAAISAAGDFNGDGIGDLLIGAPMAAGSALQSGAAYVVFGRAGGWTGVLDLASLSPDDGVVLRGAGAGDLTGVSVAAAGDVNGDGIGDVIVGAPEANGRGAAFVVYGRAGGLPAAIDLAALDAASGFRIDGAVDGADLGTAVAGVGDVNGDGFDDVLVGIPRASTPGATGAGGALLVFGSAEGPGAGLTPDSLAPGQGYVFEGARSFDSAGISVAAAGDINGDGWADLMIGADLANDGTRVDAGAVYLVHGGPGILAALDALDGLVDGHISLAHVGATVTVETAHAATPTGAATGGEPLPEVDNDPATSPDLRGPHAMVATDAVRPLAEGPGAALKAAAPPPAAKGTADPDGTTGIAGKDGTAGPAAPAGTSAFAGADPDGEGAGFGGSPWFHHDSFLFLSARRADSGTEGAPGMVLARAGLWDPLPDRQAGPGEAALAAGAVDADHAPGGTVPWDSADSPDAFAFL